MEARLILLDPPAARREVKLSLPATIGRSREAKIKLVHGQVSRVHCEFFERDGVLHVRDLGSTNGTYVGDDRVGESAVPPGETVTIGAIKFRAEYEPAEDAILPAVVLAPTTTVRTAAEATFRAQPPATTPPPEDRSGPEPLEQGAADETHFSTESTATLPVLPPPMGASAGSPPPLVGGHPGNETDFPRPVEWEELEELDLAPLDEESAPTSAAPPDISADSPPDNSLHIFSPQDDPAAGQQPAELQWRVPEPSSPAQSGFALHREEEPPEPPAHKRSEPSKSDDDSFEQFLRSLEDDKPA